MRLVDGRVVYAASDLNDYLACPHRVALRLEALAAGRSAPDNDPTAEIIARKGEAHERRQLERFVAEGRSVTRIALDEGSPTALMRAVDPARRRPVVQTSGPILHATGLSKRYGGVVAACGLAQGMDLPGSVAPFILRGVSLLGVDSVMAPRELREPAWSTKQPF